MRLFWALGVPDRVRRAVDGAVEPLRNRWPDLRWTDPDSWHITLAFLGRVEGDVVAGMVADVRAAVRGLAPVDVTVQAAAATPGGRAGIVWVPLTDTPALVELADAVRQACRPTAPPDDSHPFRGHLTLARIPRKHPGNPGRLARAVATAYAGPDTTWAASHISLMASETRPDGAVHHPVAEVPLEG